MSELSSSNNNLKILNLQNELHARRNKLKYLRCNGIAFPNDFKRNAISNQLHTQYGNKKNTELTDLDIEVSIAGRIITRRIIGKVSFITLQDMGGKIQLYINYHHLLNYQYNNFLKICDLGDIIGVNGKLFKTKTGELSVNCKEIRLLTKAIHPLPDKFHGLIDQETRYRQRYLDLITNDRSRQIFKLRSRLIEEIRYFMIHYNFMEVETPMMHTIPGGASANPFMTHHNALNMDMYLRIAPELYLKQLVIGGFERVFEINRNFRNEGISPRHNPEFTMMELYMAYADYYDMMILVEKLLSTLTKRILGSSIISYGEKTFNFSQPFIKMTMKEAIYRYYPKIMPESLEDIVSTTSMANTIGIQVNKNWGLGKIQTKIFEKIAENHLIQPTFITAYPKEVSPLARCNDNNPFITDRFECFVNGQEIGNGFSELNDYEDQANRFTEQVCAKDTGDDETMFYDENYITALEHGLPPTAGLGIGIDRLIMLFTNSDNIRDVILFPILRS